MKLNQLVFKKMSVLILFYQESDVTEPTFFRYCPMSWQENSWHKDGMKKLHHCHRVCYKPVHHWQPEGVHEAKWLQLEKAAIAVACLEGLFCCPLKCFEQLFKISSQPVERRE